MNPELAAQIEEFRVRIVRAAHLGFDSMNLLLHAGVPLDTIDELAGWSLMNYADANTATDYACGSPGTDPCDLPLIDRIRKLGGRTDYAADDRDEAAMTAHVRDNPDDHAARMALADLLHERHGGGHPDIPWLTDTRYPVGHHAGRFGPGHVDQLTPFGVGYAGNAILSAFHHTPDARPDLALGLDDMHPHAVAGVHHETESFLNHPDVKGVVDPDDWGAGDALWTQRLGYEWPHWATPQARAAAQAYSPHTFHVGGDGKIHGRIHPGTSGHAPPPDEYAAVGGMTDYDDESDARAFHTHLTANPDDEAARGAFADWLQERGRWGADQMRGHPGSWRPDETGAVQPVAAEGGDPHGFGSGALTADRQWVAPIGGQRARIHDKKLRVAPGSSRQPVAGEFQYPPVLPQPRERGPAPERYAHAAPPAAYRYPTDGYGNPVGVMESVPRKKYLRGGWGPKPRDLHARYEAGPPTMYAGFAHPDVYRPLVQDFARQLEAGDFTAHHAYPPILADVLQDHDDPRAEWLRRSEYGDASAGKLFTQASHTVLGHTPPADDWSSRGADDVHFAVRSPNVWSANHDRTLHASMSFPAAPDSHVGIHREVQIHPDEARAFADQLPDEHAAGLHAFLDKFFGGRPKPPDAHWDTGDDENVVNFPPGHWNQQYAAHYARPGRKFNRIPKGGASVPVPKAYRGGQFAPAHYAPPKQYADEQTNPGYPDDVAPPEFWKALEGVKFPRRPRKSRRPRGNYPGGVSGGPEYFPSRDPRHIPIPLPPAPPPIPPVQLVQDVSGQPIQDTWGGNNTAHDAADDDEQVEGTPGYLGYGDMRRRTLKTVPNAYLQPGADAYDVKVITNPTGAHVRSKMANLRRSQLGRGLVDGDDFHFWWDDDVHHEPVGRVLGAKGANQWANQAVLIHDRDDGSIDVRDQAGGKSPALRDWAHRNGFSYHNEPSPGNDPEQYAAYADDPEPDDSRPRPQPPADPTADRLAQLRRWAQMFRDRGAPDDHFRAEIDRLGGQGQYARTDYVDPAEADWWRALAENPGDRNTLGVFADWAAERGHPLADLLGHLRDHGVNRTRDFYQKFGKDHQWLRTPGSADGEVRPTHDVSGQNHHEVLRAVPLQDDGKNHDVELILNAPHKSDQWHYWFGRVPAEVGHATAHALAEADPSAVPFRDHLLKAQADRDRAHPPPRTVREVAEPTDGIDEGGGQYAAYADDGGDDFDLPELDNSDDGWSDFPPRGPHVGNVRMKNGQVAAMHVHGPYVPFATPDPRRHFQERPKHAVYDIGVHLPDGRRIGDSTLEIAAHPDYEHDDPDAPLIGTLHTYTHPKYRRQGVATGMYTHAADLAAGHGAPLEPDEGNSDDAHAVWQHMMDQGIADPKTLQIDRRPKPGQYAAYADDGVQDAAGTPVSTPPSFTLGAGRPSGRKTPQGIPLQRHAIQDANGDTVGDVHAHQSGGTVHVHWAGMTGMAGGEGRGVEPLGRAHIKPLFGALAAHYPDAVAVSYTPSAGRLAAGARRMYPLDNFRQQAPEPPADPQGYGRTDYAGEFEALRRAIRSSHDAPPESVQGDPPPADNYGMETTATHYDGFADLSQFKGAFDKTYSEAMQTPGELRTWWESPLHDIVADYLDENGDARSAVVRARTHPAAAARAAGQQNGPRRAGIHAPGYVDRSEPHGLYEHDMGDGTSMRFSHYGHPDKFHVTWWRPGGYPFMAYQAPMDAASVGRMLDDMPEGVGDYIRTTAASQAGVVLPPRAADNYGMETTATHYDDDRDFETFATHVRANQGDMGTRNAFSDWLRDRGRDDEADRLVVPASKWGTPGGLGAVGFHNGRVGPGHVSQLDPWARSYLGAALDTETDDEGQPLAEFHHAGTIHPDTIAAVHHTTNEFRDRAGDALSGHDDPNDYGPYHFLTTRNGHGVGFWSHPEYWGDGTGTPDYATELTDHARAMGEHHLYVGDDGLVHSHMEGGHAAP